jgi:iron-sulfur cluster repair protein YtfE (RIC family)
MPRPSTAHLAIQTYLDDQHALLELWLTALRRALAARAFVDTRSRLAGFRAHLGRYMRGEERVLFPLYERLPSAGPASTAGMRQEHGDLLRMVDALGALVDRRDATRGQDALATLHDVLLVHSVKEDWMIYPALVDALPAPRQEATIRALREGAGLALSGA